MSAESLLESRVALSIPEVCELLGLSTSHGYRLAETGDLPTVRLGKRLVVPVSAVQRLLDGEPDGEHPDD